MADHKPVDVDPKDVKRAEQMWHNFTVGSKYTIYAIIFILICLALGFVKLF